MCYEGHHVGSSFDVQNTDLAIIMVAVQLPMQEMSRMTRPSLVLSHRECDKLSQLEVVGKELNKQRIRRFVAAHSHEPLLMSYSSNTTPVATVESFSAKADDFEVRRRGRRPNDFLMERLFVASKTAVTIDFP